MIGRITKPTSIISVRRGSLAIRRRPRSIQSPIIAHPNRKLTSNHQVSRSDNGALNW